MWLGIQCSGISIQATTLSTAGMPAHVHTTENGVGSTGQNQHSVCYIDMTCDSNVGRPQGYGNKIGMQNTGGSSAHTHALTDSTHNHTVTVDAASVLPFYYTLVFCVKVL